MSAGLEAPRRGRGVSTSLPRPQGSCPPPSPPRGRGPLSPPPRWVLRSQILSSDALRFNPFRLDCRFSFSQLPFPVLFLAFRRGFSSATPPGYPPQPRRWKLGKGQGQGQFPSRPSCQVGWRPFLLGCWAWVCQRGPGVEGRSGREWILGFSDPAPTPERWGPGETCLGSTAEVGQKIMNRCQVCPGFTSWRDSASGPSLG